MLSEKLIEEINTQIMYEFYSAQLYLAMAGYCASQDLDGFANFFKVQYEEENAHAMKFFNYLTEMGARTDIRNYQKPQNDYKSVQEVFEISYEHEKFVTSRIYELMDIAMEEREHATISFLKWYVDEQVEEEASMSGILKKLERLGSDGNGLLRLDEELSKRVFTPLTVE